MDRDEAIEVEMAITPAPETNSNIDAITSLFSPFPFTDDVIENIQARREVMSNELIFDLLLEQACIPAPQTLFPPSTLDVLQTLVSSIAMCPWDLLKKSALYFYLLSFINQEVAQRNTALPPHFAALAHACFLLDQGDLPSLRRAVALLGDARIVQDLAPKVLQTLELATEPSLVRAYVRTAQPVLQAFEDAAIYVRALLDDSLAGAWVFQRGFPEGSPVRNKLVRVILDACLMPIPHSRHLRHLLSLPLSPFESSLLQAYALSPPQDLTPSAYTLLQDLITARLLSSGKYSDAIRISKSFAASDNQLVRKYAGTQEAKALARAAALRKATMQDVLNVLPSIQRRELELELSEPASTTADKAQTGEQEKLSNSMTMSWEDLGISTTTSGRTGQLEGSPAPGMNTSGIFNERSAITRTPLNKMTASIFLNSPMSLAPSPLRTPTRSMVPPPLKPSTSLGINLSKSGSALVSNSGLIIPQNLTTQSSASFAENLSKATRFGKPIGAATSNLKNARFGIGPAPTPPSPLFNSSLLRSTTSLGQSKRKNKSSSLALAGDGRTSSSNNAFASTSTATTASAPDQLSLIESDDPDAVVIRRRKSYSFKSPPPPPSLPPPLPEFQPSSSPPIEEPLSSPSARATARAPPRLFPGGFGVDQLLEEPESPIKPGRPTGKHSSSEKPSHEKPQNLTFKASLSSSSLSQSRHHDHMTRSRLKIPGTLFDEDSQDEEEVLHRVDEESEERQEEEDDIAALPPTPAPKRKQRGRGSAGAGSVESGDDGESSTTVRLRRSTRLSSVEPVSPQKKKMSKKTHQKESVSGARTRKRRAADA